MALSWPPVLGNRQFVANEQSLRRIASETGGTLLDGQAPALYQGPRAATATRWDPIWSIFMVVGLLAFLLDVAVRRLRTINTRALFWEGASMTTSDIAAPNATEQLQAKAIAIEQELTKVIVGYPDVLRRRADHAARERACADRRCARSG